MADVFEDVDQERLAAVLRHHSRLLNDGHKVKLTLVAEPLVPAAVIPLSSMKIDEELPLAIARKRLVSPQWAADFGDVGMTYWLDRVRRGEAPQPVIKGVRMTRYKLGDVIDYWAQVVARSLESRA